MNAGMLFRVGLVFDTPEYGTIVGGANADLDGMTPAEIKEMIGQRIMIQKPDMEEQMFEVVSFQISYSIIGKKNIGICLGKGIPAESIPEGSTVYCHSS